MSRAQRIGKIALWVLAGIVGAVAVAVIVAVAALNTGVGGAWAARTVSALASSPQSSVRIGKLQLHGLDIEAGGIALADREGAWLWIGDIAIDWHPFALLGRRIDVDRIAVTDVSVVRKPLPGPPKPEKPGGFSMPRLPAAVHIGKLDVAPIAIGAPVLGEAMTVRVTASAGIHSDQAILTQATIERTDKPSRVVLGATFRPDRPSLDLSLSVDEPAGGLIGRLAKLPGTPPVSIRITGAGPLDDWRGRLQADLPNLVQANGTVDGDVNAPGRLTGAIEAAFGPLMPEKARAALGDHARLSFAVDFGADKTITIQQFALAAPNVQAGVRGRIAPDARNIDGLDLTVAVPDGAKLAPLMGSAGLGAARLAVHLSGPLDAPDARIALDATDVAVKGLGLLPRVRADADLVAPIGKGAPAETPITLALSLTDPQLDQTGLDNLLGDAPTLNLKAAWNREDGAIRLDSLALKGRAIGLDGYGAYTLASKAVDAKLALTVAPIGVAAPGADGAARANVTVKGALTGALVADVEAHAERLAYPSVPAFAILGPSPDLTVHAERRADGDFSIDRLKLTGAHVGLNSRECVVAAEVSCVLEGHLDSLAPLSRPGGTKLAGRVALKLDAHGPRADPLVALSIVAQDGQVGDTRFDKAAADLRVRNPAGDAKGNVTATLDGPAGRARLAADLALTDNKSALRVSDLTLAAPGLSGSGAITADLKRKLADGKLDVGVTDAARLAALAGMEGEGQAEAHVALSSQGGKQAAQATLRAEKLAIQTAPDNTIRLASADVKAQGRDLLGAAASLSADLRAAGLAAGPLRLKTLSAGAKGTVKQLDIRAALDGRMLRAGSAQPLSLKLDGQVARAGGGTQIRLDHLAGNALGTPIALRKPARIALGGGATKVEGLALGLDKGTATIDAALSPKAMTADIVLRALPANLASMARPDLKLDGTIDGSAKLDGRPGGGQGRFDLRFAGLRMREAAGQGTDEGSDMPTLSGRVNGTWDGHRAQVAARIAGLSKTDATLDAAVPLAAPADSAVPALVRTAPLSAHLDWKGPIGPLWTLLPMEQHRLSGDAAVTADSSGTAAAPRFVADVTLANGHYENLIWGTTLDRLTVDAKARSGGYADVTLSATDGGNGRLDAKARVALDPADHPIDASLDMKNFLVTRRDDALVQADAAIKANGPAKSARIDGQVTTDKVEISLAANLPPSVVSLDVVQVNGPPENPAKLPRGGADTITIRGPVGGKQAAQPAPAEQTAQAEPKKAPAAAMPLDLRIRMPHGVFVRGKGLESEWKGDLRIGGTSAQPRIFGALHIVRGDFTIASKTIGLDDSSTITFPGTTSVDPLLDLTATIPAPDIQATLHVTGRASQPKIELSSVPELPQDEILAQMLFGKSTADLSPFEAVQLASAVADLSGVTGSGPGFMGKMRTGLGLDVLRVQSNSEGQTTVGAGKYVSKRVYVGVQQGLQATSGQVTVNIDITKHLSLETDVGAASNSRAGVNWKYDY